MFKPSGVTTAQAGEVATYCYQCCGVDVSTASAPDSEAVKEGTHHQNFPRTRLRPAPSSCEGRKGRSIESDWTD